MADKKISALTAASTPLAGTEVLPIVQSGATVKVAVSDLTAGRSVSTASLTTSGKLTTSFAAGGGFVAEFQNTTSATPYGVWFRDAATPTAGYPLVYVSDSTGATTYLRVDSSNGNTTVGIGNLVIGTSGKGIDFSATPGTGTSELLADYEEGTWTPTLAFGGASVGITYSAGNRGIYTKTGNTVVVNALLELTSKGSSTGGAVISGLPYTSNQLINYVGVAALYGNITVLGTIQPLQVGNTTNINLYEVTATGATTQLDNTDFANNSYVYISFSYQV